MAAKRETREKRQQWNVILRALSGRMEGDWSNSSKAIVYQNPLP